MPRVSGDHPLMPFNILRELEHGPATHSEVAIALNVRSDKVLGCLRKQEAEGRVKSRPFAQVRDTFLWMLPEHAGAWGGEP